MPGYIKPTLQELRHSAYAGAVGRKDRHCENEPIHEKRDNRLSHVTGRAPQGNVVLPLREPWAHAGIT